MGAELTSAHAGGYTGRNGPRRESMRSKIGDFAVPGELPAPPVLLSWTYATGQAAGRGCSMVNGQGNGKKITKKKVGKQKNKKSARKRKSKKVNGGHSWYIPVSAVTTSDRIFVDTSSIPWRVHRIEPQGDGFVLTLRQPNGRRGPMRGRRTAQRSVLYEDPTQRLHVFRRNAPTQEEDQYPRPM